MRSMSRCSVLGTTLGLTTTRQAHADVIKDGMKAADAIDKAFKRAEQIFFEIHCGLGASDRASAPLKLVNRSKKLRHNALRRRRTTQNYRK